VIVGGGGFTGEVAVSDEKGKDRLRLDGAKGGIIAGGNGVDGNLSLRGKGGLQAISMAVGAEKNFAVHDNSGREVLAFNAGNAAMYVGAKGNEGDLIVLDNKGVQRILLNGGPGDVLLRHSSGEQRIELKSHSSEIILRGLGGGDRIDLLGLLGQIIIKDSDGKEAIVLDGVQSDIRLKNADCAEEFPVKGNPAPGTVLVLEDGHSQLRPCDAPYDTRVAGVVSGAGTLRPGILLGSGKSRKSLPVALVGKVYCQVEASSAPIRPGTLLTTSSLTGHAMAATDRNRAFGAVLGKALSPLRRGRGTIPILVALQ